MVMISLVLKSFHNVICQYLGFARIYLLDFDTISHKWIVNNNITYSSSFKDAFRLGIPLLFQC